MWSVIMINVIYIDMMTESGMEILCTFQFSCWLRALLHFSNLWRYISNYVRMLWRIKELWYSTLL